MKSLFADFLQNVTPPGAFKQGYTVFYSCAMIAFLCFPKGEHLVAALSVPLKLQGVSTRNLVGR